jgi:alkylated DNA repair dioxygenase AlkB
MTSTRTYIKNSWLDEFRIPEGILPSFEDVWDEHPEEKAVVIMYGNEISCPRWQQSYMNDYTFTGMAHEKKSLPKIFEPVLGWVNNLGYGKFNQVMLNWYENGHHYIGTHADSTVQLEKDSEIVSISLGATRKFRIRDNNKIVKDIELKNFDTVVMGGIFQDELKHEIVKVNGKKGEMVKKRINITFRKFK